MLGANIDSVGWPACGEIDVTVTVDIDDDRAGAVSDSDSAVQRNRLKSVAEMSRLMLEQSS